MRPEHCGHAGRMTPGDRVVVDAFRAYLTAARTAENEGTAMPDPSDYFATSSPYVEGRRDQAAGTVDTGRTADREYVRGLADQRTVDVDRELAELPDPSITDH